MPTRQTASVGRISRDDGSLAHDSLSSRIGDWRSLTGQALWRRLQPGLVVTAYPDRPEIKARLTQLVAAEKECCPFLAFDITPADGEIRVELRCPAEFVETLGLVLGGEATSSTSKL
jgi:hypothetical protein